MANGGVTYVRRVFNWREVQPREDGAYDWTKYDRFMQRAALHGITVLPIIVGSPSYVTKFAGKQPRTAADLQRFSSFVTALVDRYGNDGSFWQLGALLPTAEVTWWQVWNEPNLQNFWAGELRPDRYVSFLARTRAAIKRGDPSAKIVTAGMPETKDNLPMSQYLRGMYRDKRFEGLADAVAVHSYARNAAGVEAVIELQRRIMRQAGDAKTPVWVTEMGWASSGPSGALVKDEEGQARLLTQTFDRLSRDRSKLNLGPTFWYDWRDARVASGVSGHFSQFTGLFERDREPKPSWSAFVRFTGGDPGSGAIPPGGSDLGLGALDYP